MVIETTTTKEPSIIQIATQEILPSVKSAAPLVKDFVPPVPTPDDEYPGYYQLPNKQWAAYDPSYYQSVSKSWQQASVEEEMRRRAGPSERVRKQWQGDEEDLQQISAMDEASRTQAEIESSKQLTAELLRSGPTAPNMKMTVRLLELDQGCD
jgi:proline-rich protein PRCC